MPREEVVKQFTSKIPLKRLAKIDDIVAVTLLIRNCFSEGPRRGASRGVMCDPMTWSCGSCRSINRPSSSRNARLEPARY
jgi:hypothetical protein